LENICNLKLSSPLGEKFRYSDVNFIVLGEIVGRVSGKPLDVFCQQYIFGPLEMNDTAFGITDKKITRTAPTERREGRMMRGEVHDPRAYKLDRVAGHAGLFSTTSDLAKYARMVLGEGTLGNAKKGGVVILSAKTCREWTQAREIPGGHRGYGCQLPHCHTQRGDKRLLLFRRVDPCRPGAQRRRHPRGH
jgi:CubicO group peptidase (beta-lactamase class C family)